MNITRLPQPGPRRDAIFEDFRSWAEAHRPWSPKTIATYYRRAVAADRWLIEERGTPLFWAKPRDLRAYLFSSPPSAKTRNRIRRALIGLGDFLVAKGFWSENAAQALPALPEA